MRSTTTWLTIAAIAFAAGCNDNSAKTDKPAPTIAPTATALAPAKPATMEAKKLSIEKAGSKVDFLMEAPEEKIVGHVPGTTTGDLQVDFMDLTKSTGLISVDISGIELFQTKADKKGKFGEEKKVDAQNEHARAWLEIGEKVSRGGAQAEQPLAVLDQVDPGDGGEGSRASSRAPSARSRSR